MVPFKKGMYLYVKVATLGCSIYPKASKAVGCCCLSSLVISLPQSPEQCAAPA